MTVIIEENSSEHAWCVAQIAAILAEEETTGDGADGGDIIWPDTSGQPNMSDPFNTGHNAAGHASVEPACQVVSLPIVVQNQFKRVSNN